MTELLPVARSATPATLAPMDATAVIIAFNEELHIARCISRIREHVARVVVIDSFSTDRTCDLAREHGAEVLQNPFVNHAAQFNWGVEAARVTTAWVLRLDADEYLDAPGIQALKSAMASAPATVSAFSVRRRVIFHGRLIRFGGIGNIFLTRAWRTGLAEVEARWMDEQVLVREGATEELPRGAIVDENLNDIGWWTAKHNSYTTRQMVQMMLVELNCGAAVNVSQLNSHVRRKRILRERLYSPMPLFVRAIAYFLYRYIFALGFLDGRAGFLFHFFQGMWNFFLVDVKVLEAREVVARGGIPAFKEWLRDTYRIDVPEI